MVEPHAVGWRWGAGRPVWLLGPEPKVLGKPVSGRGLGGGAAVRHEGRDDEHHKGISK